MDNLIRARLCLPIVQLDYSNITGTMTQTLSGSGGQSFSGLANTFARVPSVAADPVTASFPIQTGNTNMWTYSLGAMQMAQLTITAQPVNNLDRIYTAYKEYANDRQFLVDRPRKPHELVHLQRTWFVHNKGPTTYWIPDSRKEDFFTLYLLTTVSRQQPTTVPTYQETSVVSVHPSNFNCTVKVSAMSGKWTLTGTNAHGKTQTISVPFDASDSALETQIRAMSSLDGIGTTTVNGDGGGANGGTWVIQPPIEADAVVFAVGAAGLNGGTAGVVTGEPPVNINYEADRRTVESYEIAVELKDQIIEDAGDASIVLESNGERRHMHYQPVNPPNKTKGTKVTQIVLIVPGGFVNDTRTYNLSDLAKFTKSLAGKTVRFEGNTYGPLFVAPKSGLDETNRILEQQRLNQLLPH